MPDVGKVNTKAIDDIGKINLMDVPAAGVLAEDTKGVRTLNGGTGHAEYFHYIILTPIAGGADYTLASDTRTYANSRVVAGLDTGGLRFSRGGSAKVRVYINGIQGAETGYILGMFANNAAPQTCVCQQNVNGRVPIIAALHNYYSAVEEGFCVGFGLVIGAVKLA